jgi:hypothetical protein
MFYVCGMDKRNYFNFILCKESPLLLLLFRPNLVILLVSQIPTGGSKEVGGEYRNTIHFCHMVYIKDKGNHIYLVLLKR